jgi:hypothetical protein
MPMIVATAAKVGYCRDQYSRSGGIQPPSPGMVMCFPHHVRSLTIWQARESQGEAMFVERLTNMAEPLANASKDVLVLNSST